MHRDGAVGLQQDQAQRPRQPRAEAALVLHGAVRDQHPHAGVRYRPSRRGGAHSVRVRGANSDGIYKLLLVLHIFCAIVGFGAVYLNALYGRQIQKRQGREGLAIYEANFRVSAIGQYFIYGVFVFGFLLVLTSDDAWEFSQTWIWLAMALYIVGLGVSHGVLLPAVKRMGVLMRELVDAGPPPRRPPARRRDRRRRSPSSQALGTRVGASSAFLDVLMIVILALMVWKPGDLSPHPNGTANAARRTMSAWTTTRSCGS